MSSCCLLSGSARISSLFGGQFKVGWAHGFQHFQYAGPNFARFGMAARFLFGEDQLAIDPYVEYPARGRNHFPTTYEVFDFTLVQDLVRQTDGIGLVSSSGAILDDDLHSTFLHETSPFKFAFFASDIAILAAAAGNANPLLRWQAGFASRLVCASKSYCRPTSGIRPIHDAAVFVDFRDSGIRVWALVNAETGGQT